MPFKVCYLFKAVQTFTERWQPWNAEAGLRLRAAAVGNRCSPQPLQTRSPSGRVSTQTVPEICVPDSDRSRQQPHTHTHTHIHTHTHTRSLQQAHSRAHCLKCRLTHIHRQAPALTHRHTHTFLAIVIPSAGSFFFFFIRKLYNSTTYLHRCLDELKNNPSNLYTCPETRKAKRTLCLLG